MSKKQKTKKYKLGTLFYLNPKRNPKIAGRELVVVYDERVPAIKGFEAHYAYLVRFLKKGNTAGNHYHIKKCELFVPVCGKFTLKLEDIKSKRKEKLTLDSKDYASFYIDSKISHAITSEQKNGILLVLANVPPTLADERRYEIK